MKKIPQCGISPATNCHSIIFWAFDCRAKLQIDLFDVKQPKSVYLSIQKIRKINIIYIYKSISWTLDIPSSHNYFTQKLLQFSIWKTVIMCVCACCNFIKSKQNDFLFFPFSQINNITTKMADITNHHGLKSSLIVIFNGSTISLTHTFSLSSKAIFFAWKGKKGEIISWKRKTNQSWVVCCYFYYILVCVCVCLLW